ncbi:MAG TPA: fimbrial biogenesis outer membrane usher protein [Caulobacteraceae bacterium]|nr:fimbrial biogenesis outer membrane usher protein [Caulobacteraceae bacterium]
MLCRSGHRKTRPGWRLAAISLVAGLLAAPVFAAAPNGAADDLLRSEAAAISVHTPSSDRIGDLLATLDLGAGALTTPSTTAPALSAPARTVSATPVSAAYSPPVANSTSQARTEAALNAADDTPIATARYGASGRPAAAGVEAAGVAVQARSSDRIGDLLDSLDLGSGGAPTPGPPAAGVSAPALTAASTTTAPYLSTQAMGSAGTELALNTITNRLNPTGRDVPLTGPIQSGGVNLGEISFVLTADDRLHIDAQALLRLLAPILNRKRFQELSAMIGSRATVTAEELKSLGYTLTYVPETISLTFEMPADARATRVVDLGDRLAANGQTTFVKPAGFSAYVTALATYSYFWTGQNRGGQQPLILLDAAARYDNIVLESEQSIEADAKDVFQRQGTRFVYDDLKDDIRWTLGDLQPTSRGFSGTTQLAGISAFRSYQLLDPTRNVQPLGNQTFTLAQPSTVQAYINGLLIRQIRLDPGVYNLRDFPFAQGANNVSLVITNPAGQTETVRFSLFFDANLLAPGLSEFGFYAGFLAPFAGSGPDYHFDQPGASGYYRRGITQNLTLGANFQIQKTGGVGGVEATWATPFGTVEANLAGSYNRYIGSGYAAGFQYTNTFNRQSPYSRSIAFTVQTQSVDFATPQALVGNVPVTAATAALQSTYYYQVEADLSQSLPHEQYLAFNASYSAGRAPNPSESEYALEYGKQLTRQIDIVVAAEYLDEVGVRGAGVRATINYIPNDRTSVTADVDTVQQSADVIYSTSSQRTGVNSWNATAQVFRQQGTTGIDANFDMRGNRAEWGIDQESDLNAVGGGTPNQITTVHIGTSIAFADGHFALSQPIYDAFAIVTPHSSLGHAPILLDRDGDNYLAASGPLGPAVDPGMGSYAPRTDTYDVPKAPVGYDLGPGTFSVMPPYRAGYVIVVGSDYSVTGVGRLLSRYGEPVSLLAGQATEVDNPQHPAIEVFTNRDGRFGVLGMRPGKWRITMPTDPASVYLITIPEGAKGMVALGDQHPER